MKSFKLTTLLALIFLAFIKTSAQTQISHLNTDIIIDDDNDDNISTDDPTIKFDLGYGTVDNIENCNLFLWDWRFIGLRLEPNLTEQYGASNPFFGGNLCIGWKSGLNLSSTLEKKSTFIGNFCGQFNTSGYGNTALGFEALNKNVSGGDNIALGLASLKSNTTGSFNIAIGTNALFTSTTSSNNVGIGYECLYLNTGQRNIAIGFKSTRLNTTGNDNSAIGFESLYSNTTGVGNVALGHSALRSSTTNSFNTVLGAYAGQAFLQGMNNVFIGESAGCANGVTTPGNDNVFIGSNAGDYVIGSQNVIIGSLAGGRDYDPLNYSPQINIGSGNIIIGYAAAQQEQVVDQLSTTVSNQLWINNAPNQAPLVWGDFSTDQIVINGITPQSGYALTLNGDAWKTSPGTWAGSDIRLKNNIAALDSKTTLNKVLELEGIQYVWNDNKTGYSRPEGVQLGFSAQNLQQQFPELVKVSNDGYLSACYEPMDAILVESIKEMYYQLDSLKKELADLRNSQSSNLNQNNMEISRDEITLTTSEFIILEQNAPNPFNEKTTIKYHIPINTSSAQILFYNNSGQLINKFQISTEGWGELTIFGSDLSSGVYNYCLFIDGLLVESKSMIKQ